MSDKIASPDMWQYKPWWCQPWTIILTGILIITGSWLVVKNLWLTVPVACLIVAWWAYFLVIVPRMLAKMMAAERG